LTGGNRRYRYFQKAKKGNPGGEERRETRYCQKEGPVVSHKMVGNLGGDWTHRTQQRYRISQTSHSAEADPSKTGKEGDEGEPSSKM